MKKEKINVRALIDSYQVNCDRLNEIADACEAEKRELTTAEADEKKAIERANDILRMKIEAASSVKYQPEERALSPDTYLRDQIRQKKVAGFQFRDNLEINLSDSYAETGVFPLNVQEILTPLREGLILDKVGLPFLTGLAGDYIWPVYEAVEATIAGEGVELSDSELKISKLKAEPQRIGLAIPVSRESVENSVGVIQGIITTEMPQAVTATINKALFSPTKISDDCKLVGPFVDCDTYAEEINIGDSSAFKQLNLMKAQVLATGIDGSALCWVMTKANKAILECTPKDAGSGLMICENDTICGVPVFTTNYIGEDTIGFGDFRYQPMGLFGTLSFIVDPYTLARKGAYDFVLNVDYGTTTLRPEAFLKATVNTGTTEEA